MSIDLLNDKQLKIFDHEIDLYYDNFIIVENNARYIHALSKSENYLRSFTLNKKDKYSQWASLRNEGGMKFSPKISDFSLSTIIALSDSSSDFDRS